MVDFFKIYTKRKGTIKQPLIEIYPKFIIKNTKDLMVRGGDFYAIWLEEQQRWSTDEQDVLDLIDTELSKFTEEYKKSDEYNGETISTLYMWDSENGMMDKWLKYVKNHMRDKFTTLDETLIWSNSERKRTDYSSKQLSYPLEKGSIVAWDELVSTLYEPDERHKIEWSIGSIVSGDSKTLQKFLVFYGSAGTGKSTILNIIEKLFDGYYCVFDAKALGNSNSSFALEAFKNNPLVAIQHDGDLSRIEDNTRLNSVVSHELMTVNEKFKSTYSNRFKCFLFMGTNKPVKITDAKSGLIRRLIDVKPSGRKLGIQKYRQLMKQIDFELGPIAYHCREVYKEDPNHYDAYVPIDMMGASNDFYNFIMDNYFVFEKSDGTSLKAAWEMYKTYCDDAKVLYPYSQRVFKEELKNYFMSFRERHTLDDGTRVRNYYLNFRVDRFEVAEDTDGSNWLKFNCTKSIFDKVGAGYPAQYGTDEGIPASAWMNVTTTLKELDTSRLHYVRVPLNHIVVDLDITDEEGNKDLKRNLAVANQFPPTYAELSKSGNAIHLHYIYTGDVDNLAPCFPDNKDVEIKVFKGKQALRRLLTKCNNLDIATISSGLPLKERGKKVIEFKSFKNDKKIRELIDNNLHKQYLPGTKPSIDFIWKILEDAYKSDLSYDVSDLKSKIISFAGQSTHQAEYCLKKVKDMKFMSEDRELGQEPKAVGAKINKFVFYDVEVFPNLFVLCWKFQGKKEPIVRLCNPTIDEVQKLLDYKLVGFNNRRYDNHILYAWIIGYDNEKLYKLSQSIINADKGKRSNSFFPSAYGISETDIYDFASAGNKMSLKKLEIKMGIHHQELGIPWDKPVPEELWQKVADYCCNDVIATEAAFDYLSEDWTTRKILADIAGLSNNDTTNTLTTKIIFGSDKNPQSQFRYRDLALPVTGDDLSEEEYEFLADTFPEMMSQTHGEAGSLLPYFPGYKFEYGRSTYRGEEVGEGGWVYAEPGVYSNVGLLDITSMHPHSAMAEILFGVYYTRRFKELVYGRVDIKHEKWDDVREILDGKMAPYVEDIITGKLIGSNLANALKTPINSVYGLTSAKFDNPFKDKRNVDNIVAKRGALFMIDLQNAVQEMGYTVAHIKTDSIKIPNIDDKIINFVMDFGKRYGYSFEHEATYEKMCLVNDAVYVAKYKTEEDCEALHGYVPKDNRGHGGKWTATGTQFQVPYVFKTLFSKEPIVFEDMCETKSVTSTIYIDMNETLPDVSEEEKALKKFESMYRKGELSDTSMDKYRSELEPEIAKGHRYVFVGKVGQFCPVKDGADGGLLMREKDGKMYAVTGTKGYRWLESEMIRETKKEDCITNEYHEKLVEDAYNTIAKYTDDVDKFIE